MRTVATTDNPVSTSAEVAREPASSAQGAMLEAARRRDERWRTRRRQSLQAELRTLQRLPARIAVGVFVLVSVLACVAWILSCLREGRPPTADTWLGAVLMPPGIAWIPALLARALAQPVCDMLRTVILRRAKNDGVELSE